MKLLEPQGLLIILAIVLIIFGPNKLPDLGKMLGKTMKSVREGLEDADDEPARPTATPASAKQIAAPTETLELGKEPERVAAEVKKRRYGVRRTQTQGGPGRSWTAPL
jgi:sec-independent protein translocase protein TatA